MRLELRRIQPHNNIGAAPDVTYSFTKDPGLLQEYYDVREACYKTVWGLNFFSGAEDRHDRTGHILVAQSGGRVVGGARLVINRPGSPMLLPLEEDGFILEDAIPEYSLSDKTYGEVGRFAILPEFCGGRTLFLGLHLLGMAQLNQCRYLTTVAPEDQAKKYVSIGKHHGFEIRMFHDLIIPDRPYYNQIPMKLLIADLKGMPDMTHLIDPVYLNESTETVTMNIKEVYHV